MNNKSSIYFASSIHTQMSYIGHHKNQPMPVHVWPGMTMSDIGSTDVGGSVSCVHSTVGKIKLEESFISLIGDDDGVGDVGL